MRISQLSNNTASIYLNKATDKMNKSAQRLASGKRILTAADDASGLARVQTMKAYKTQLEVDTENLNSAKNYAETKDGALAQITDLAQEIAQLQASDNPDADVIAAYTDEINSILTNTEFNGKKVFSKDASTFGSMTIAKSNLVDDSGSTLDFSDATKTKESLDAIIKERAVVGAYENGIDARISVNSTSISNLEDSISRIEDVDIEKETLNYNKQYILQQLATQMIGQQANNMYSMLNLFG